MSPRRTRSAFTLVELLVVIGIISVLIAILLPALSAARESAKAVKCVSNLRQLAVAAQMYCNTFHGSYPIAYYDAGTTSYSWDFTTDRGSSGVSILPGLLWLGKADARIQQCPSFEGSSNSTADPYTGYNYNTSYIGHGQFEVIAPPIKQIQVRRPSSCALFGDGQYAAGANKYMRSPFPAPGDINLVGRHAGTQGFRHRGRTNVVYCDGHAQTVGERSIATSDPAPIAPGTGFLSTDNSAYDPR